VEALYAGIDWGGQAHQLCLIAADGRRVRDVRVGHDVAGLAVLDEALGAAGSVTIAIERAEGLLVEHLVEAGHLVYPVNPRIAARIRERYRVAPTKDDSFDAFTLADGLRHEHERWRPIRPCSPLLSELRAVVRDRERIVDQHVRTAQQLRAILETYHPAAARLFSSPSRQVALQFVRDYPTPDRAARLGERRMQRFLERCSYTGRVPAAELVERLRANLMQASAGTTRGRTFSALHYVELVAQLVATREAYDEQIAALLARHPDAAIFRSFPGVGPVTAAGLLAEIGEDRDRFPSADALLAEAGLAPVTRRSGQSHRVRFRYAANHHLRRSFTWMAYNSLEESDWARAAYRDARHRGQRSYRALRGLGARWGRVVYRCWHDHTTYDASRHGSS
jgi:transposase